MGHLKPLEVPDDEEDVQSEVDSKEEEKVPENSQPSQGEEEPRIEDVIDSSSKPEVQEGLA